MNWLAVALGGAIGAVLRYAVYLWSLSWNASAFPAGTFAVNIIGSFLIGLLWTTGSPWNAQTKALVFTGVLGGFTTFSTFSLEVSTLFKDGDSRTAIIYLLGSVVLGLAAAGAGMLLGQRLQLS